MKREEFLKQLEQLLDGISEEEKADALAFYRSYFEDAGEENEESVIAELESPEKVAQSIKKNLGMEKENGSYGMPADQNPEWNKNDDDMFVKSEEVPKERWMECSGNRIGGSYITTLADIAFSRGITSSCGCCDIVWHCGCSGCSDGITCVCRFPFDWFWIQHFIYRWSGCRTWTDRSRTFGIGTWNPCSTSGRVGVWRIPSMGSQGNHRFV